MKKRLDFKILPVRSSAAVISTASLFKEYAASLSIDLSYQNFSDEVTGLPGLYAPPTGDLLLGVGRDGSALGCVALRGFADGEAEMKRLFVAPRARGLGLGAALASAIIARGRALGYSAIKLDTLPEMAAAQRLYATLGFSPIAPYYDTPIVGTVFLRRSL